jgi:hypothetical protein
MNIGNDFLSPLRQKGIQSIQAALNILILCRTGANKTPATATKYHQVVLNQTVMEAPIMGLDIKILI